MCNYTSCRSVRLRKLHEACDAADKVGAMLFDADLVPGDAASEAVNASLR